MLTRTTLLANLERLGLTDIDERKLRFWETEDVLPRPVRQRHAGATRAVYPIWYVNLVFALRHFQERGYELKQLRNRMRLLARYYSYAEETYAPPANDIDERWRTEEPPILPFRNHPERSDWDRRFDFIIKRTLLDLITPHAGPSFDRATRLVCAELTLIDEEGERVTFSTPIPAPLKTPDTNVSDS